MARPTRDKQHISLVRDKKYQGDFADTNANMKNIDVWFLFYKHEATKNQFTK